MGTAGGRCGAGQEKTSDLVLSALVRGRFGEVLSPQVARGDSDLFLMGLLSLIDVMLEVPMETVLDKIPLDGATKAVLMGQPSSLRPVFQLMLAHECGEWEAAAALSQGLQLDAEQVAACYWQAQTVGPRNFNRGIVAGCLRCPRPCMTSCAKAPGMGPCAVLQGRVTYECSHLGLVPAQAFCVRQSNAAPFTDPISGKSKPI